MFNLLRSEGFKLRKSKAFYACLVVGCALIMVSVATMQLMSTMIKNNPGMLTTMDSSMAEFGDGNAKVGVGMSTDATMNMMIEPDMATYLQSVFSDNSLQIIIAVFISIFIAGEFHNGTIKNLACRGQSRIKLYLSKLFTTSAAAIVISLCVFLFAFLLSGCLWGFELQGVVWWKLLRMLALELYLTVALTAMLTSISVLLRSTGGSIAVNLCLIMFAGLILQLVNLLGDNLAAQNYWIINNFAFANQFDIAAKTIWRVLFVGAAYFLAFTGIGAFTLQKRDI